MNENPETQTLKAKRADVGEADSREPDALYQRGKIVGRVLDLEVESEAREVRFGEIYQSDGLLLPEECEFREYRIIIQKVADATKVATDSPHKGRILRGCVADILGYREQ